MKQRNGEMPNRKDAKYYKPDTQQNVALRQMKLNIALVLCTAKKSQASSRQYCSRNGD